MARHAQKPGTTNPYPVAGSASAATFDYEKTYNTIPFGTCHCGCGNTCERVFKQGGDATLKADLLKAWALGNREAGVFLLAKGWSTVDLLANYRRNVKPAISDAERDKARKALDALK